ncbi:MAG: hypothetical protein JSW71_22720 [Gemmatimonadota bacterium]|nr:MAG: hypothetical protein JSW71_22720 [Gemmatimonadota bacterium]
MTQETIDEMAALRRQGLPFEEIGTRLGCSERTARRYVGHVEPELALPPSRTKEGAEDPRQLRARLRSEFLETLHQDKHLRSLTVVWRKVDETMKEAIWGGPPSILFLNEAERLLQERLDELRPLALTFLAQDKRSKGRFMREVVGQLYWDYVRWHEFVQKFGETGEDWRPPRERPPADEEELWE